MGRPSSQAHQPAEEKAEEEEERASGKHASTNPGEPLRNRPPSARARGERELGRTAISVHARGRAEQGEADIGKNVKGREDGRAQ
jgi:hypothetical protein